MKYKIIAIGIDQSYKNTGISIAADGVLKKVSSINLEQCKTKTEKRNLLKATLDRILSIMVCKAEKVVCVIERVRLRSKGFLSLPYIQSMGALNAVIIDCSAHYGVPVFSVDTRCWKSRVVGTCSGEKNPFGVPENKYPTVKWVIKKGFESSILVCAKGRKCKGTFVRNGQKLEYDNDAADSAAIAMFYFVADKNKLKPEE